MLCSDASLSPSISLASISEVAFLSLAESFALGAMFFSPAGTIIGARGLSESGSTYALSWSSLGVPLKPGAGSLRLSGTISPAVALSLGGSPAHKLWIEKELRRPRMRTEAREEVTIRDNELRYVFIFS